MDCRLCKCYSTSRQSICCFTETGVLRFPAAEPRSGKEPVSVKSRLAEWPVRCGEPPKVVHLAPFNAAFRSQSDQHLENRKFFSTEAIYQTGLISLVCIWMNRTKRLLIYGCRSLKFKIDALPLTSMCRITASIPAVQLSQSLGG